MRLRCCWRGRVAGSARFWLGAGPFVACGLLLVAPRPLLRSAASLPVMPGVAAQVAQVSPAVGVLRAPRWNEDDGPSLAPDVAGETGDVCTANPITWPEGTVEIAVDLGDGTASNRVVTPMGDTCDRGDPWVIDPLDAVIAPQVPDGLTVPIVATAPASVPVRERPQWPVSGGVVTQGFWPWHQGVDIGVPIGTPVRPMLSGTVSGAGWDTTGFGWRVVVEHPNGWRSSYNHLSTLDVTRGQWVSASQVVGYSGSSGRSTGPHLHWDLAVSGRLVDPRSVLPA